MKQEIIVIKLGGSVITNKRKPYTARKKITRRLALEIKRSPKRVVVVHGSGSFGHTSASKYGGIHGYSSQWGIAKVARDAMTINAIVREIFLEEKLPVISLSPMSMITSKAGSLHDSFFSPIDCVLHQGLIPLLYGDGIWDLEWNTTIFSGERVITEIVRYLQSKEYIIDKIIEVGNTNGVYDMHGRTIPTITPESFLSQQESIGSPLAQDVTGGMRHKVEEALFLAKMGTNTMIINGEIPGELFASLENIPTKGTLVCQR